MFYFKSVVHLPATKSSLHTSNNFVLTEWVSVCLWQMVGLHFSISWIIIFKGGRWFFSWNTFCSITWKAVYVQKATNKLGVFSKKLIIIIAFKAEDIPQPIVLSGLFKMIGSWAIKQSALPHNFLLLHIHIFAHATHELCWEQKTGSEGKTDVKRIPQWSNY